MQTHQTHFLNFKGLAQFCRNEHLTRPSRHAQLEGDLERLHISFVSVSTEEETKGHLDKWKKVVDGWMDG